MKEQLSEFVRWLVKSEKVSVGASESNPLSEVEQEFGMRHVPRSPLDSGVSTNVDRAEGISYDAHGFISYRGLYCPR